MDQLLITYGEAAKTAIGFFWKAGWAFVLGYAISAAIQTFVPKTRLTRHMGDFNVKSTALAAGFGSISSSCSFAALAAARSLVLKGANWIAAVAFMFASTNLVIELGILIFIFLGWQYLVAEIVGGILLIAISGVLMRFIYPQRWLENARERVESGNSSEDDSFDPWARMTSLQGWRMVGHQFVMEWKMVWQEILIGFTIAGLMKAFVPTAFWEALFLQGMEDRIPSFLITLENVLIAPFVAAATFIGSMGNIPLATVLAGSGVGFAGLMAFIYSDLMVPPLVKVNAKYYGWPVALYIAGIMFISIVITALVLDAGFSLFGLIPDSASSTAMENQFAIDYTFFFNLMFLAVGAVMFWLHRQQLAQAVEHDSHEHEADGIDIQKYVAYTAVVFLAGGMAVYAITA